MRGISGAIVIIEEAAFVPPSTIKDIFVPLLIKDECCLIALSTLGHTPSNYFNKLLATGKFKVYEVSYICAKCKKKGFTGEACLHRKDAAPHWNNVEKMSLIKALLMEEGEAQFQLETLGINPDDKHPECFPEPHVKRFISRWGEKNGVDIEESIRYVITSIDPVAGSDHPDSRQSDLAIISIAYPGNIIVGIEALDVVDPDDYEDILIDHVQRIFNEPLMRNAKFILDVESGTGLEAGHIRKLMINHFGASNVIALSNQKRRPGSLTTEVTKAEGVQLLRQFLRRDDLRFWKKCVSHHPNIKELIHGEYQRQLLTFKKVVTERANGLNGYRFTGKTTKGTKDDLAMVTMLALLAHNHFFSDLRRYADYK